MFGIQKYIKIAAHIFVFLAVIVQSSHSSPVGKRIKSADELKRHGIGIALYELPALLNKERNITVKWKPQAELSKIEGLRIEIRLFRIKPKKTFEHVSTTRHYLNKNGAAFAEIVLGDLESHEIVLAFGDGIGFMDTVFLSDFLEGLQNNLKAPKDDPFANPDKKPKEN